MPISYGRQHIDESDIEAVVRVLRSDWLTQGPDIKAFEEAIAAYTGAKFAVAVSSGTTALHIACKAADLGPGDQAITTPITFAATSNAVLYCGARPRFADIQEDGNIDPEQIRKQLNSKTKVILPVDFSGLPADIDKIRSVAGKKRIIIEDSCHALGGEFKGKKVGACEFSDMTIFSFHPVKPITTGEGGCVTTNNEKLYKRLKALSSHGVYRTPEMLQKKGGWFYEMRELGFNYRMTDFQAALGLNQLKKISKFIARRREVAKAYDAAFRSLRDKVTLPALNYSDRSHAWHLYFLRLNLKKTAKDRRALYDFLKARDIHAQVHYVPVYQHPFYKKNFGKVVCPKAEQFYKETLSLPMHVGLQDQDVNHVIQSVKEALA